MKKGLSQWLIGVALGLVLYSFWDLLAGLVGLVLVVAALGLYLARQKSGLKKANKS